MSNQLRRQITDQIIAALEQNLVPWRRPWRSSRNAGRPTSVATGRPYGGINALLLQIHADRFGLQSRWWGTYRQWKSLGGDVHRRPPHVEPGQWGCRIVFYKNITKATVDPVTGEEDEERFPLLRSFMVFNIDQVDGSHLDRYRLSKDVPPKVEMPRFDEAEKLIAATGSEIRFEGDQPCYVAPRPLGSWPNHSDGDYVVMPHREWFHSSPAYYETALHELSHWAEVRTAGIAERHGLCDGRTHCRNGQLLSCVRARRPVADLTNHAAYLKSGWTQ